MSDSSLVLLAFGLMVPVVFCIWKALQNVHDDVRGPLWLLAMFVPMGVLVLVIALTGA